MNTFLLTLVASAKHDGKDDVKITTKHAGGRKSATKHTPYKFSSKYYTMSDAFKHVLKKDKPSNQCEVVSDALVIECPPNYHLERDARYPFCESVDERPFDFTCAGIEFEGECYELANSRECPEGFFMDKFKKQCQRSIFGNLEYQCPDPEYAVKDGKKGKYCEKEIEECEGICPQGAYRDHQTGECIKREPVAPPTCPPGFELSQDMTYCSREVTRPCGKKDGILVKKEAIKNKHDGHGHHLRRLGEKVDDKKLKVEAHKIKGDLHKESKYVQQVHTKPIPEHGKGPVKAKDQKFKDVFGYKVHASHAEKSKHGGPGDKMEKIIDHKVTKKNEEKQEGKKTEYIQSRLVDKGLCTYEEFAPAIPSYVDNVVPEISQCVPVFDLKPVERICEPGYDLVHQKDKSEPVCVQTDGIEPECPPGTFEINRMCYEILPRTPVCTIGYRMNDTSEFCVKSDIVPPKYQWLLARQCEGYKCIDYYEHSCIFK